MTARRPHDCEDPGRCLICRRASSSGLAHELADAIAPGRATGPGEVDHALILSADLQRVMSHVGRVALLVEDASLLLRAARRAGRIDPAVMVRVSEAIADAHAAMSGRLTGANAVPPDASESDHGDKQPQLTDPPAPD
ncbi:hypothetical protein HCN51_31640 [Nonomuraea sp. FMUSA5-5]|uniref:ANTAR domain-containing protein n=1 Tax=Nonomuraea composti TaxID=2720023 RepID=A0ABX1B7Y6_9ACTN|nr:hypothetical protein [Nonomuraea sp. FMUSA5-5]NJP93938.1 hypothetical protein [Nonomuraea sp. FMUSA5-5]